MSHSSSPLNMQIHTLVHRRHETITCLHLSSVFNLGLGSSFLLCPNWGRRWVPLLALRNGAASKISRLNNRFGFLIELGSAEGFLLLAELSPPFSLSCGHAPSTIAPSILPLSLSVSISLPPSLPHVLFSLSGLTLSLSFKLSPFLCLFLSHPVCLWETAAVHQDHSQTWFMMPLVLPKTAILVNLSVINLTTCALSRLPPHCSTVLLYFYRSISVCCLFLSVLFVCLVACFFLSHLLYFSKCP